MDAFPFKGIFSLKPLIDFWNETTGTYGSDVNTLVDSLRSRLAAVPELIKPIEDLMILNGHEDLVRDLMNTVFPTAYWDSTALAVTVPFSFEPVWVSPEFRRALLDVSGRIRGEKYHLNADSVKSQIAQAYNLVLEKCYGINEGGDQPLIHSVEDLDTGLHRYYSLKPNFRFTQVHVNDNSFKAKMGNRRSAILNHINEPEELREILPPYQFEFHGFVVLQATDVTEPEEIAQLSKNLIDKDSVVSQAGFLRIEERLKTLFRKPDIEAGLAAIQGDQVLLLNHGQDVTRNCIFADSRHVHVRDFDGSVFEPGRFEDQVFLIRDLQKRSSRSWVDNEILEEGFRSLIISPLYHHDELIGILKLSSPEPDAFGTSDVTLATQIRPLFTMAIKGVLEKINREVDSVIKVKCTAIHPSVEWRFRKAAFDHLERMELGEMSEMEPIVFRDVYPLYAASDIRGSSEARNRAIQKDLNDHLRLALNIVQRASATKPIPILKTMAGRIASQIDAVDRGIGTGEDVSVIRFIQNQIEQMFPLLAQSDPMVAEAVNRYNKLIDPRFGTVYQARKAFEDSVTLFNARLSDFLDREEAEAQSILPHYFSKHQTDGLDYVIYVGESIVQNGQFTKVDVSNLRLWQFIVACGMAWWTEEIRPALGVPLEATHLILVTHTPLSIRFRYDEKRFDVDGVHDIAHEIIRSRIDKAMVRGRTERLTQPGKIAVVYSRPNEAQEVRLHIERLQNEGFLHDDMEWLELEDLQSVQGLKAIRIGINVTSKELARLAQGDRSGSFIYSQNISHGHPNQR